MNWTYIIFILIITTTIIFLCIKKNKDEFTMKKITMDIWKDNINMLTTYTSRARICVVCYDNRKNDDITKLKSINTTYCKKNGYDFKFYDKYNDENEYPQYWLKVKIMCDVLKSNKYDYVMWIDSDACFYNHNIRIENIFKCFGKNNIFVMSHDRETDGLSPFNAGVWIVNNNHHGLDFMNDWLNKYNSKEWTVHDKVKWVCKECADGVCKECPWGGKSYEQGSCLDLLSSDKYISNILYVDSSILQEISPSEYTFVLHFYGPEKSKIKDFIYAQ